jgi:hypothetical protein
MRALTSTSKVGTVHILVGTRGSSIKPSPNLTSGVHQNHRQLLASLLLQHHLFIQSSGLKTACSYVMPP